MYSKNLTFDIVELYTENTSHLSPAYMEASNIFAKVGGKGKEVIATLYKNIKGKIVGKKLTKEEEFCKKSKGDVDKIPYTKFLDDAIQLLNGVSEAKSIAKDIDTVLKFLRKHKALYEKAYEKKMDLVTMEFENAVFLIVLSASFALSIYCQFDLDEKSGKFKKFGSPKKDGGVIFKALSELTKQITTADHIKYLEYLLKIADEIPVDTRPTVKTEAVGMQDALGLMTAIYGNLGKAVKFSFSIISGIWKTMFGILPLMRVIVYLRLKHKANTIIRLEEQVRMIKDNIEQLEKEKTRDPKEKEIIIRKQKAYIEAYNKKCEKLRAQLMDTEKEAVNAMEKNKNEIKEKVPKEVPGTDKKENKPSTPEMDDDFVLD